MLGDGGSARQLVVLGMRTDPEPQNSVISIHTQRAMAPADPNRPEPPDLLEMKRGMLGIALEKVIVPASLILNLGRHSIESSPELGSRMMLQISRLFPSV